MKCRAAGRGRPDRPRRSSLGTRRRRGRPRWAPRWSRWRQPGPAACLPRSTSKHARRFGTYSWPYGTARGRPSADACAGSALAIRGQGVNGRLSGFTGPAGSGHVACASSPGSRSVRCDSTDRWPVASIGGLSG